MKMTDFRRFTTIEEVKTTTGDLRRSACCGIDLRSLPDEFWPAAQLSDASFLGCKLTATAGAEIAARGGWIMAPFVRPLEYDPFRAGLYTQAELLDGYTKNTHSSRDQKIYCQYTKDTKDPDLIEALARRIHDYSIDEALEIYLKTKSTDPELRIVGVMGGASTSRGDEYYRKIALACRALTRTGQFLVVSGGGTGIMEAASLGAFFANDTEAVLLDAITQLQRFPRYNPTVADSYTHYDYIDIAVQMRQGYKGTPGESLSIPTWFYGHEPTNVFAERVAKYFANSIREEGLTGIGLDGVIFAPGSAGTSQEIFMDAAQNHYNSFDVVSPMVFLGKRRYFEDTDLYRLVVSLSTEKYKDLIRLFEEPGDVVTYLQRQRRRAFDFKPPAEKPVKPCE